MSLSQETRASSKRQSGQVDGAKRGAILAAAAERFGRDGYDHTKWADVAADVSVGSTALYHYFESKQHCLYVLMDDAVQDFRRRFVALTADAEEPLKALAAVLQDAFDLSEQEVLRNRMLVAAQGLLAGPSASSGKEEAQRQTVRARMRELECLWESLLTGAMRSGAIPEGDPQLLSRAILGLYNSVWHWYRPGGAIPLERIADFYTGRALAMMGVDPDRVVRPEIVT